MPEVLTGCPVGDTFSGSNPNHCYCGHDNMCCYCRMPIEEARMRQEPSLTRTAEQYQARYTSPRYSNQNWFVDAPTTTTTASWGIDNSAPLSASTISWTPVAASDAILENLIFEDMISAPEDDGSEEVKD